MTLTFLPPSSDKTRLEDSGPFTPKFDDKGLITAIVTDAADGAVLMVAHMNEEALGLTLQTGIAHYFSRSRQTLWKKGETSGNIQTVVEMRTDCDQDCVWLKVSVAGHDAACHTGRKSCFYRVVTIADGSAVTEITDQTLQFDPGQIYNKN
jgi:phosphoribosyl-AMP cyclohydrolase